MERGSLQDYVESAQSVIEESPQMGEATTKAAILRDFIELLNWEIPTNTELEYSVKAFGKTYKVDYALLLDGRPVAFLEAKGLDTSLTDKHREQLSEYLRSEDVNWGILTNGKEYEFYQRRVIESKVVVEAVERTGLQGLPRKDNIIEAYQTETIRDEESQAIIEHIRELREAWETLTNEKEELATATVDMLTDSVSGAIKPNAQSQAKEMIDRLIDDVESEIETETTDTSRGRHSDSETAEQPTTQSQSYSVELAQDGTVIEEFEDTVQSGLISSVVSYLIQNHGLVSAIEPLPYIPGNTRAIINDDPSYNERDMAQPRELEQGYYLEVNLSWAQKKREIHRLANTCGLEVTVDQDDSS